MKKKNFSEAQIVLILRNQETGRTVKKCQQRNLLLALKTFTQIITFFFNE